MKQHSSYYYMKCAAAMLFLSVTAIAAKAQNSAGSLTDSLSAETPGAPAAMTDSTTTALEDVTVSGARVANRADRQIIYPTREQKASATSGYALLGSLAPAGLRVDEQARAVTSLTGRGLVQMRINGIVADAAAIAALDTEAVERIEYTDRPGVRYGEDTGYVVNFIVRRSTSGYTVGADLNNTLTPDAGGRNSLFGRANRGKDQWEAAYSFAYTDERRDRETMTAAYTLPDGLINDMSVADLPCRTGSQQHDFGLTYSHSDSGRYVLQVKAGAMTTRTPECTVWRRTTTPEGTLTSTRTTTDSQWQPTADVYWQRDMGTHQQLTANAVLTGFVTDYDYRDTEEGTYGYAVAGRSWSLSGETVYENSLRPFTVTAGLRFLHKRIDNDYTGDVSVRNRSRSQTTYVFGQIAGRIGLTEYTAGLGMSQVVFRQPSFDYDFVLLRPKVQLGRALGRRLKLTYDFETSQHVSSVAKTNGVTLRRNLMETERGNPALRPNRVTEHTLKLAADVPRLSTYIELYYKRNDRPNLMEYLRETDSDGRTTFVYTQSNQPGCHLLMCQGYVSWQPLPHRLSLTAYGGPFRFFNYGSAYRHFYTSLSGGAMVTAWLGAFTLTAYADSGFRWMEGELRGRQAGTTVVKAQWQRGNWAVALRWTQPLTSDVRSLSTETTSRYVHKETDVQSRSDANRLSLNLTYTLSKGRKYRDLGSTITNRDSDAGLMR